MSFAQTIAEVAFNDRISRFLGSDQDNTDNGEAVNRAAIGDINAAADEIQTQDPTLGRDQALDQAQQLFQTIAGTTIVANNRTEADDAVRRPRYVVTANATASVEDRTRFTPVRFENEMLAEIRSITREITEVIVHWTDSFDNANLSAYEIDLMHKAVGHDQIQYHYIIKKDGSIQRGRPVNLASDHVTVNGHNQRSIAVAFVGGINYAATENVRATRYNTARSINRHQFNAFDVLIRSMLAYYPGIQILGHNDIDPSVVDPGFDVIEYAFAKYGVVSLFEDPAARGPFTTQEIANYDLSPRFRTTPL